MEARHCLETSLRPVDGTMHGEWHSDVAFQADQLLESRFLCTPEVDSSVKAGNGVLLGQEPADI